MPSLLRIVPLAQRRLGLLEQGQSPVLPGDPEPPPGVVEQMIADRRSSPLLVGFALPVFGAWPGWMTVLVVALLVLYLLPPVMRLIDRHPVDPDEPVVEHPSRHDMSSMRGWDEYVIGQRLEREVAPEITASFDDEQAGWSS